jgi:hypothetical protein
MNIKTAGSPNYCYSYYLRDYTASKPKRPKPKHSSWSSKQNLINVLYLELHTFLFASVYYFPILFLFHWFTLSLSFIFPFNLSQVLVALTGVESTWCKAWLFVREDGPLPPRSAQHKDSADIFPHRTYVLITEFLRMLFSGIRRRVVIERMTYVSE